MAVLREARRAQREWVNLSQASNRTAVTIRRSLSYSDNNGHQVGDMIKLEPVADPREPLARTGGRMVWRRGDTRNRGGGFSSAVLLAAVVAAGSAAAEEANPKRFEYGPHYRPSSSSKVAVDISTNAYGAYKWAPKAPKIGDRLENIKVPTTKGDYDFSEAYKKGPVVLIFYRGFW